MSRTWLDKLIDGFGVLAGALLCGLVVLVSVDVAVRYGRLFAMPWAYEVAEYALYATTFLGAPWVLRDGGHISVDIVVDLLTERARRRLGRVTNVFGTIVSALLLYLFGRLVWRSYSQGTLVYETLIFPEWILFSVAPLAFLLLLLVFARASRRRGGDGIGTGGF